MKLQIPSPSTTPRVSTAQAAVAVSLACQINVRAWLISRSRCPTKQAAQSEKKCPLLPVLSALLRFREGLLLLLHLLLLEGELLLLVLILLLLLLLLYLLLLGIPALVLLLHQAWAELRRPSAEAIILAGQLVRREGDRRRSVAGNELQIAWRHGIEIGYALDVGLRAGLVTQSLTELSVALGADENLPVC